MINQFQLNLLNYYYFGYLHELDYQLIDLIYSLLFYNYQLYHYSEYKDYLLDDNYFVFYYIFK